MPKGASAEQMKYVRSCAGPRKRRPLEERFWAKVDRSAGPEGCWPWTGATVNGYGVFGCSDRDRKYAHRVSWEITSGPIPEGQFACHHCDNRPCVNPTHLFLGTQLDNMRDMIAKGRKAPNQHQRRVSA